MVRRMEQVNMKSFSEQHNKSFSEKHFSLHGDNEQTTERPDDDEQTRESLAQKLTK